MRVLLLVELLSLLKFFKRLAIMEVVDAAGKHGMVDSAMGSRSLSWLIVSKDTMIIRRRD